MDRLQSFRELGQAFGQACGLPFASLISTDSLQRTIGDETGKVYTPAVTLWMFLSQVLSPDGSYADAVARLVAWRAESGLPPCSANNGAFCKARQKLDEQSLATLVRESGAQLHERTKPEWLWKGRAVTLVDGTTFTAADTPENQAQYPQPDSQKPGLGFPMIRAVALISLAVGAVRDWAAGPYSGKGTGEISLLRRLIESLEQGTLLVGDAIYCVYAELTLLAAREVDFVLPQNNERRTDFRRGTRLGRRDHIVTWTKPGRRPERLSQAEWAAVPETLRVREVEIRLHRHGFRSKTIIVVTTLLDAIEYSASDLGELYAMRWEIEVDLRSIKSSLGMGHLRCRTPPMLRRELAVALLAVNLLRGHLAEAARRSGLRPRDLGFTGAIQTLNAFSPLLRRSSPAALPTLYDRFLSALATHRVSRRPGRQEPRKLKRRDKHPRLMEPRSIAKTRITKLEKC
jgi:hypothetical protein